MKRLKNKRIHIKEQIFLTIVTLITGILIIIFIVFNFFMRAYVRNTVETQVALFISIYEGEKQNDNDTREERQDDLDSSDERQDDLDSRSKKQDDLDSRNHMKDKLNIQGEALLINDSYEIINSLGASLEAEESNHIVDYLKGNLIDLSQIGELSVKTNNQYFYITSLMESLVNKPDNGYLLYVMNVTVLEQLLYTINFTLGAIIIIAVILTFLITAKISVSISKPILQLSDFASRIGKGDFKEQEFSYRDEEFTNLADTMNKAARQLKDYDHEQKAFFENVSHELRTPLMTIKCYAEGMEYGLMETVTSSRIITQETDRLTILVDDLLYLSKMDNITNTSVRSVCDLRETLSSCAETLKPIAEKHHLIITYDFDSEPVLFYYDENQMYRAFSNLISNALRYAKDEIILSCMRNGGSCVISIKDDGHGISEVDLPHIFDRFYKGKKGNYGIGLSIAKSVIEHHLGRIEVSNGNYTSFTIVFKDGTDLD